MKNIKQDIIKRLAAYEKNTRVALSKKIPAIKKPILFTRRTFRSIKDGINLKISNQILLDYFPCVIARHQSVLVRRLGDSDYKLQQQKIINLQQASKSLDGLVIPPGKIFSLWKVIGRPSYQRGYVDGMLLSDGKVVAGLGGGLCQLSNFLYWIFLHTSSEIKERYHHSLDVFPDSGRVLPFGSGATILDNFIDLKVKNISNFPWQIKIWLSNNHLKGQILSTNPNQEKIHVFEKNHYFIKRGNKYFRYNQIYRQFKVSGKVIKTELVAINFAPVLYKVSNKYLKDNNFKVLDFTNKNLNLV
jgi:vancomycin resistance protein VanW